MTSSIQTRSRPGWLQTASSTPATRLATPTASTRPRSARRCAAATGRRRAASESEKGLRPHQLRTEHLRQLNQPVVSDGVPQLDASWLTSQRNDLDSTKPYSVPPRPLDHYLLDLVFGEVEVFHPFQLCDQSRVLIVSQGWHQLAIDVAGHCSGQLRPAMRAWIDAE